MSDLNNDTNVIDRYDEEVKEPSMYKVIFLNDHYTTWDFVIQMLEKYFAKTFMEAQAITKSVHEKGKGVAGIYTRDIAITKMAQVNQEAVSSGHPLALNIEEA